MTSPQEDGKPVSLETSVTHVLDEARMLIPGVQALFGFQLVAVFSDRFATLNRAEQAAHLAAVGLSIVALLLLTTPAVYHRQVESGRVSQGFVNLATRMLAAASVPLAASLAIDFALIARLITENGTLAILAGALVLTLSAGLWFVMPRTRWLVRRLRV